MTTEITQERVVHVLLLGERIEEFRRVRELLQGQGNFHVHGAHDAMSAASVLAEGTYDAVLVDSEIWENSGPILLEQMRLDECSTAVVVIADHEGAGGFGSWPAEGAHEMVCRETLDDGEQLTRKIAEAARHLHSTKRDTLLLWLAQDARTDALTGLNNTHTFDRIFAERCEDAKQTTIPVALVLASIYGHAAIARTYGAQAGDELLRRAAACVSYCVRGNDFAARIGCDTFAVLIDEASIEVAQMVARRIAHRIHQENAQNVTRNAPIEVAFGIASGVAPAPSDLMAAAMAQIETQRPAQDGPIPLMYSDEEDGPSVA